MKSQWNCISYSRRFQCRSGRFLPFGFRSKLWIVGWGGDETREAHPLFNFRDPKQAHIASISRPLARAHRQRIPPPIKGGSGMKWESRSCWWPVRVLLHPQFPLVTLGPMWSPRMYNFTDEPTGITKAGQGLKIGMMTWLRSFSSKTSKETEGRMYLKWIGEARWYMAGRMQDSSAYNCWVPPWSTSQIQQPSLQTQRSRVPVLRNFWWVLQCKSQPQPCV